MPSVAEQLRQAREQQKLSVYDVAEATKIRTDHVRALEEGNYNMFAAPVYIRGFVRSYAKLLKLDMDQIAADLDHELAATEKFKEPPNLAETNGGFLDALMLQMSKLNWQLLLIIFSVGLVILISYWTYRTWEEWQSKDPLEGLGPGLYQPAQTNTGELLPLPVPVPAR